MRPLLLGMGWSPDQPGGLNRFFRALVEVLPGDPVAVVVGPASDTPAGVCTPASADDFLPLRLWRFARAVPRSPELVDAHFALYAFVPLVLGRLRRTPAVVHFHGPWADESAHGRRLKRTVERLVYRHAGEFVVLSQAFRRILIERYAASPWHVHVIPPGVDLEHFSPGNRETARARLDVSPDALVALAVRRLVPRMGLEVLLDAWSQLGDENRVLLIAGEGPQRRALESRAGSSVRFLGRVDESELVACYRAADVSVVPSVELEGFGLVVLESLACGTPAIVSDVGGLPEAIDGLDASLVVPAGDSSRLTRRLEEPLPERKRCREFAERFNWHETARRTVEIYERTARPPARTRLRIVYLDHTAQPSGGELALLRLLPALADEVESHVVLAEDGPLVSLLAHSGISVEVLPLAEGARGLRRGKVSLASSGALRSGLYALRLARRLRQLRPDLVHTNSLKAALYGGLAGKLAGIPVVWHLRDRIADDYLPPSAVRLVRRAVRRLPSAVIANSASTLATLPEAPRGRVVPSPVRIGAVRHHVPNGPLRIGIVGRIAPWKGQDVFLEAFARAFPDGPEEALVIGAPLFGSDEEAYLAGLHRLSERLGVGERVEFTGFREDIAAELSRLDVLVHASTTAEPFGLAVAEGLAGGLPVVATAAGGPTELIEDGVNGLLYPPGDADALAGALRRLAADAALRDQLGAAARLGAAELAPEHVAARVLEVYRELLRA